MKRFIKTRENFTCGRCGARVSGDGYTNHCPQCLWSKHVDIYPGDRAASCCGMMRPIAVETQNGVYRVVHRCERCGYIKRNRISKSDDMDVLVRISEMRGKN